jgi:hypothetical protein
MSSAYADCALPNAGLANRLFCWARCQVYADRHGLPMLAPQWTQIKLGPVLRREKDWRWYTGLFRPAPGQVTGVRRWWVRRAVPAVPEPADLSAPPPAAGRVLFEGMGEQFGPLHGHHAAVRAALLAACRPRWAAVGTAPPPAPIMMHVRRGDFGAMGTPLDWFVSTLQAVRRAAGRDVPAAVLSDGRPDELAALLAEPAVTMSDNGSALGDLLALSRARVLIGSGGSSFSLWAAYLGQMPGLLPPGHPPGWFKLANAEGRFLGEYDPTTPPPDDDLRAALAGSHGSRVCGRP